MLCGESQVEHLVSLAGGDVVLFAVDYRLNAWGFLALPQLAAEDPRGVSGNLGLLVCARLCVLCVGASGLVG